MAHAGCLCLNLKKIYEQHGEYLEIINIFGDNQTSVWFDYVEKEKIDWRTMWDGKGSNGDIWRNYGIKGVPTFYLIGTDGMIIDKWVGYDYGLIESRIKPLI